MLYCKMDYFGGKQICFTDMFSVNMFATCHLRKLTALTKCICDSV